MTRARYFRRGGRGVYTCETCGRQTRETIQGMDSKLCGDCWDLAGMENTVLDRCATVAECAALRDDLVAHAVRLGGSEAMIKQEFKALWEEK
jgi:hypothetical protein